MSRAKEAQKTTKAGRGNPGRRQKGNGFVRRDELMPLILDAIQRDRDGVATAIAAALR